MEDFDISKLKYPFLGLILFLISSFPNFRGKVSSLANMRLLKIPGENFVKQWLLVFVMAIFGLFFIVSGSVGLLKRDVDGALLLLFGAAFISPFLLKIKKYNSLKK